MKGVRSPGVSAGSKSVGASVKCTAHAICPAGASACAGRTATVCADATSVSASIAATMGPVRRFISASPHRASSGPLESACADRTSQRFTRRSTRPRAVLSGSAVSLRAPGSGHIDQRREHRAVVGARDDAAKPEHLGALVEPQLAKVDGPAVVHPYRIATEQPREVQAHREVVDVGRVKKRAAERTARQQREETPARLGAADALESRGADRTGSFLVLPQEAADANPALATPANGGDGRQR